MDITRIIRKTLGEPDRLDIQEAFNIYNLLRAQYVSIETVQLFMNFVHDADWEIILDQFRRHLHKQVSILEKMGQKFGLIMPTRPPLDIRMATRINEITDDYIYKKIYHDLVAELITMSHALRSTSTNDMLRNIIIKDLTSHLADFDSLYKFGKEKGWEETYPAYKTAQPHQKELLSTSEAFHIWYHINLRYEQVELLGIFANFAHDVEFRAILQHGAYIFEKQVKAIEQLALIHNVMLPNQPSLMAMSPIDPETIRDQFMYRILLNWELNALDAHVRAIIETIRNDPLRKQWSEILETELGYYDNFLKYGKMKGWTRVIPIYGEPVT